MRSKIKNLKTGTTQERTFRAGEPLQVAEVSKKDCQYTYNEVRAAFAGTPCAFVGAS